MNYKFQSIYILILIIFSGCGGTPLLLTLPSTTPPSFKQANISELAVIVVPGENIPQRAIEDQYISIILKKGYKIVSRSDFDFEQIMNEMKLQYSEITDTAAAEIGKIKNIPAILIVRMTQKELGRKRVQLSIGARLVSVEKAEVLWVNTFTFAVRESQIENTFLRSPHYILSSFPSKN